MQNVLTAPAATSRIYRNAGRTFLEVVRFDRHGMFDRSGTCTLHSVNAALLGMVAAPWHRVAGQMLKQKFISQDFRRICAGGAAILDDARKTQGGPAIYREIRYFKSRISW